MLLLHGFIHFQYFKAIVKMPCCGSGQRTPKNSSNKAAQAAPVLAVAKDSHALKIANQVNSQIAQQLRAAKHNPNLYLNRYM